MVPEEGGARLSLRPSRATAFAAGLGSSALPCVALFLPSNFHRNTISRLMSPRGVTLEFL
jgi:hypothetical protein